MTSRIEALSVDQAPEASVKTLNAVKSAIGMVPNLHRTLAHSPAALTAYTSMASALSGGVLSAELRESIALATAGKNQCAYCASAHTAIGKGAGVEESELALNLRGESGDPKTSAALIFVIDLIESGGAVSGETLRLVRAAGFTEEELVEIVTHVGLNSFTNMFNILAETDIDFPIVELSK